MSRYYQSVADGSTTPTGSRYPDLPDNILVFICTFDPFDRDFPRYTFQCTCQEADHRLKLGDGFEEGLEQGAYEKALETAKAFLAMGLSPEQVAQDTKPSLELVQGLRKNQ